MIKTLRSIRLAAVSILIFEVLAIISLAIFYGMDLVGFQQIFTPDIIIGIISLWMILNISFLLLSISSIGRKRQKSDLVAADIIGNDIQEAYNFGMLGLVVTSDEQTVLWTNEIFNERQINILDLNIIDWQPKLKELVDLATVKSVKIEVNARNYEVKYLREAHLYIFKDITAFESLYNYSKQQAPVVGIIMLDNYSDTSVTIEENNDVILSIRNTIFEYAKEYGVLLRRYRPDAYFAICNFESFELMQKDRFSLLDKVRNLTRDQDASLTLSMGFALGFPDDILKLNEMASTAIDVGVSRGGDQVVINQYGAELEYIGGRSQAQEGRNKVKVRTMADSIVGLIKNSSNVIIMAHTDMDLDALGASLGVKAICDSVGKKSAIVFNSKQVEKKTRMAATAMFSRDELAQITISPKDALAELKTETLLIICDVHRPSMTMTPSLLEEATKVVVIDHHRRGEEFINNPLISHVEPSASSASELVTELVRYATPNPKLVIPSSFATIMLAGIFLDTNYYRVKTVGMRTFESSMYLKESGADNAQADFFLKDDYEEHNLVTKIMANNKTPYYGIIICKADPIDIIEPATLSKVANMNIQIKGVNATFVIGKTEAKEVKISARSDNSINVQFLLEKLGGGGHFTQAACAFANLTIDEAEKKLMEVLETYLAAARVGTITKEK